MDYGQDMVQNKVEKRSLTISKDKSWLHYFLKEHHVDSKENWTGLNFFPSTEATWFNLEESAFQTNALESTDSSTLADFFKIDVYLAPTRQLYKRQVYSTLDWVRDIGGLFVGLHIFGAIIMAIYNSVIGSSLSAFLLRTVVKKEAETPEIEEIDVTFARI